MQEHEFESFLMESLGDCVGPEKLRELGKQAAMEYLRDGTPLNDSIRGIAKQASLNSEKTRRVVEHANTATFLSLFRKGYDKNVSFPVADTSVILCSQEKTASAVATDVPQQGRYIPGQEGVSLQRLFCGDEPLEKTAAPEKSRGQMSLEFSDLRSEAAQHASDLEELHTDFELTLANLREITKVAAAEGNTSEIVGAVIESATGNSHLLNVVFGALGNLATPGKLEKLGQAGWEPTPNNQVTGLVQDLDQIAQKMLAANSAMERARQGMTELLGILQGAPMMPGPGMADPASMFPPGAPAGPEAQVAMPPEATPPGAMPQEAMPPEAMPPGQPPVPPAGQPAGGAVA